MIKQAPFGRYQQISKASVAGIGSKAIHEFRYWIA